MKKNILTSVLLIALISLTYISYDAYAQAPTKGVVIDVTNYLMGGSGTIDKAKAESLVAQGKPLGFLSGGKVYFIYREDGTNAAKKIAKYAKAPSIGIVGKKKTVNGINIIIMTHIDVM